MSNYSSNVNKLISDSDQDLSHSFDQNFTSAEELLASLGETFHQPSSNLNPADWRYKYIAEDSASTSDWNYGEEGLLPPLRRPDVNQIPADVLALLLKTARFGEILNFSPCSTGPQESNSSATSQGLPHQDYTQRSSGQSWDQLAAQAPSAHFQESVHPPLVVDSLGGGGVKGGSSVGKESSSSNFTLSPVAKEFVPRSVAPIMDSYNPNDLAMAVAQIQINLEEQQRQQHHQYAGQRQAYPHQQQQQPRQQFQHQQQPPRQQFQQQYQPQPRQRHQQHYQQHQPRHYSPRQQPPNYRYQQYRQPPPAYSEQYAEDLHGDPSVERVLTTVTDTIAHLTANPGDFNSCVRKTIRVLQECLYDGDTLGIVITLIVEQSIANRNFSYTGAKLCQSLNENGIRGGGVTVKESLIRRVEEVFKTYTETLSIGSLEMKEREIGLLFFLAELFMNYKLEQGKGFFGFGVAALEIMTNLISDKPDRRLDHESIKYVVQVLKLAGWDLENHSNPKLRADMEKLMKDLSYIVVMNESIASQTKEVVQRVIDLKKRNWDREQGEPTSPNPRSESPTPNTYNGVSQHPVYELPESEEDELVLDDEPDEVNEFYEEFLRDLQNK